jgi:hypothetical protein
MAKTTRFNFRVSTAEKAHFQAKATAAKMTQTDYFLSLLGPLPNDPPRHQTVQLCPRCSRIGIPSCEECKASVRARTIGDFPEKTTKLS